MARMRAEITYDNRDRATGKKTWLTPAHLTLSDWMGRPIAPISVRDGRSAVYEIDSDDLDPFRDAVRGCPWRIRASKPVDVERDREWHVGSMDARGQIFFFRTEGARKFNEMVNDISRKVNPKVESFADLKECDRFHFGVCRGREKDRYAGVVVFHHEGEKSIFMMSDTERDLIRKMNETIEGILDFGADEFPRLKRETELSDKMRISTYWSEGHVLE